MADVFPLDFLLHPFVPEMNSAVTPFAYAQGHLDYPCQLLLLLRTATEQPDIAKMVKKMAMPCFISCSPPRVDNQADLKNQFVELLDHCKLLASFSTMADQQHMSIRMNPCLM